MQYSPRTILLALILILICTPWICGADDDADLDAYKIRLTGLWWVPVMTLPYEMEPDCGYPSATGTANQANVGNSDIESVPFAPPQKLSEQRRIVARLDELQAKANALKTLQAETSTELDALMPSILDKAFRGVL